MKTKILLIIAVVVLLVVDKVQAVDVDFYSDAVIEDGDQYNNVRIFDTPPDHTTVDMFGGSTFAFQAFDSSTVNVYGGEILGGIESYNGSTVNIYGGSIRCSSFGVRDSSILNIYGGELIVNDSPIFYESSVVNIYGYGFEYGARSLTGFLSDGSSFIFRELFSDEYLHMNLIVVPEPISAEIDIKPTTLNLASKGKWVTCYIRLPDDCNVADINPDTILLERRFKSEWKWFNEKQNVVMAKFPRSEIAEILEPGDVELTVTGYLNDGSYFTGTDTIKVIDKGRLRGRRVNSNSIVEDGIEYYMQTDKLLYKFGEDVEMLYRVTNLRDEDVLIGCSRSGEFNLWVQKDGETIWMKVQGWYWFSPGITLSAGESEEIRCNWDMKDNDGNLLEPGVYNVVGVMYNEPWNYYNHGIPYATEVAVPIKIIPGKKKR